MKIPRCKPWICAETECRNCTVYQPECPQDCQFQVLHALDRSDIGWFEKPRRSGKTFRLMEIANKLIEVGLDVVIVTRTIRMRDYIRDNGNKFGMSLFVSTLDTYKKDLTGQEQCFILTEELSWPEVQDIMHDTPQHPFLVGYWSETNFNQTNPS